MHKKARRYEQAESTVRRGIAANPRNALLRQALADLSRQLRRHDEARLHFLAAMKIDPELTSVYDSWGRMEAKLGNRKRAAQLFRRGLRVRETPRLYHALGVLQDATGQAEAARATFEAGLAQPGEQHNPTLLHSLGKLEEGLGNHAAARVHYRECIETNPQFTMAYLSAGQLEESLGSYEAAARLYGAGATVQHADGGVGAVQLWQSWARMEERRERPRNARALYERAASLYPHDDKILVGCAKLCDVLDDPEAARHYFGCAIRLPRPAAYAYQSYAWFEAQQGEFDRARELYATGAALNVPGEHLVPLLHSWAVVEWKQRQLAEARRLFVEAEGCTPRSCAWLYVWRARFEHSAAVHLRESAPRGKRRVSTAADDGAPQSELMRALLLARHYYARAVTAAPVDPSGWRLWAELERDMGDGRLADALHTRSVEEENAASLHLRGNSGESDDIFARGFRAMPANRRAVKKRRSSRRPRS